MKPVTVLLPLLLLLLATAQVTAEEVVSEIPDLLLIDDFESGIDRWHNDDTGTLEAVDDGKGGKAMRWTATDDGIGHIILKKLDRAEIDFSQYQLLSFRIKLEGKKAWNVNPVVHQYPAAYGYRALYYSIDTLMPFGEWFDYTQDLRRWENAWPDTFSTEAQEFQFEIAQLAGAEATRVYIDDIRLLKNPLGIERSYDGRHGILPDGTQVTHFDIRLRNQSDAPIRLAAALREGSLTHFTASITMPETLLPGESASAQVQVKAPLELPADLPKWYGETAIVGFSVLDTPGLTLFVELTAGTLPEDRQHPCILATPEHVKRWQAQWSNPETRKQMDRAFVTFVNKAEEAMVREQSYPVLAHVGITRCPKDDGPLAEIIVESSPYHTYQCPQCGKAYSGPLYDAGMLRWSGKHQLNAADARNLGLAAAVTGRRDFANAAARILRTYVDVYPKLPVMALESGSPAYSHTSGAARIGSTYMRERGWLTDLAIALDFILPMGVMSEEDLDAVRREVFAPSAHLMMDHKVGAMNLQWMIASAGLFAGLASDHPTLVARSMYDPHGVQNLLAVGYLDDGNWWENPSYQNVANGIAYPVLTTCLRNGIIEWEPRLNRIFSAQFRTYGPDGRGPTLGTGGPGGWNYAVNLLHSLADVIDDPELAWAPHHLPMWRATSGGGQPYDSYLWALTWQAPPMLSKEETRSPIPTTTTHLEDYGGLALRVPDARNYCYFYYGRELVHGHRNKLSLNAFAKGEWFMRNVAGGYGDNFKNFLETIASSNTVMVDGTDADWDTGELLFHATHDGIELASAREVGAWKDVEHERSIVFTGGPLVVIDRLLGDKPHRYDWLYHANLTKLELDGEGLATHQEPLGETSLYESLLPDRRFGTPATAHFTRPSGSGLRMAFLPRGELFAFKALGKSPGLLWRQDGDAVGFAAVYWPYAKDESGDVAIEAIPVQNAEGQEVDLRSAQAVRVTTPDGAWLVLVNYTGKPLSAASLSGADRIQIQKL